MARKTHDLVVVTGEFQTREGETKKRYLSIGAKIQYDDGGSSLLIDRHINLAGLPGEGPVRVSMFEPRVRDGSAPPSDAQPKSKAASYDEDIPF